MADDCLPHVEKWIHPTLRFYAMANCEMKETVIYQHDRGSFDGADSGIGPSPMYSVMMREHLPHENQVS